eukprot:TRINITY_DN95687_c0_g1_i1.p1 TRINITY_DN95687_c0_g1~~TRINITY_DN95687_c0_g1_i1.p1  ORF type:complete len:415 (+),score=80.21 TRINITY_DN95687_c0_g1_i1:46-1245(+)
MAYDGGRLVLPSVLSSSLFHRVSSAAVDRRAFSPSSTACALTSRLRLLGSGGASQSFASIATVLFGAFTYRQKRLSSHSGSCRGKRCCTLTATATEEATATSTSSTSSQTLQKEILRRGRRPETPNDGDYVVIHYLARLEDGTLFDSSRARGKPYEFILGEDEVIDGWDVLIGTMEIGERATFVCPPEYAYGEYGVDPIVPPNATVFYDVELLDIGRPVEADENDEDTNSSVVDVEEVAEEKGETQLFWEKDAHREAGAGLGYKWEETGSGKEIEVSVPLGDDLKVSDIRVEIKTYSLRIGLKDKTIVDGKVFSEIISDDSHWDMEWKDDRPHLVVTLAKMDASKQWTTLLEESEEAPEVETVVTASAQAEEKVETAAPAAVDVIDVDAAIRAANEGLK